MHGKEGKKNRWMYDKHLFNYKSGEWEIYASGVLCDCDSCLDFYFEDCFRKEVPLEESMLDKSETSNVTTDNCYLDDSNEDRGQHVFEFVSIPPFVAVVSYNSCEPVYIIKVTEKDLAKEELKDRFGHVIYPGELYLKGSYLKLTRSKNIARKSLLWFLEMWFVNLTKFLISLMLRTILVCAKMHT